MREAVKDRAAVTMAVVLGALVLLEYALVPHDQPRFAWHHLPGYAALIGLGACLFVVQLSKALGRWLLQRPERDDD
jgi:hypothetical protein